MPLTSPMTLTRCLVCTFLSLFVSEKPGSKGGSASFSSKSTHGKQALLECTRAHRASKGPSR